MTKSKIKNLPPSHHYWSLAAFVGLVIMIVAVRQINSRTHNVAHAAAGVNLSLSPSSSNVGLNQNFNVSINLATASTAVDAVDIYSLRFNPSILQVVDSNTSVSGVQIAPTTLFPNTVVNTVDNSAGTIQFSQSTASGGSTFTGSGSLATITFKAVGAGSSQVAYDFTAGSTLDTNVVSQGIEQLESVTNATYTVDSTGPSVSITSPTPSSSVSGTITVTANATDASGVAGVQFKLDGVNLGAEDTSSPYSASWNTTTSTAGTHSLTAVARDTFGNTTTSSTVSVTVNNADVTLPTVSITSPAPGAAVNGTITITATATDNVSVAGVQFKLDGVNLGSEDTSSPYSASWNTTTSTAGTHSLTAVARDGSNNTATSTAISVTVSNNTLPVGTLDSVDTAGVIRGWTYDPDSSSSSNQVKIYIDGPSTSGVLVGTLTANVDRPDIRTNFGITGNHGFTFNVPSAYQDGKFHQVYAYGLDFANPALTFLLNTSPQNFNYKTITLNLEARTNKIISGTVNVLNASKTSLLSVPFTTDSAGNASLTLQVPSQVVYFKVGAAPFLTRLVSVDLSQTIANVVIPQLLIGDIVQDNIINSIDYSVLNSNWFTSNASGDLNQDGLVNSIDYSFMNKHWLTSGEQ